ncbi:MAG: hypothetical protein AMJ43_07415 [Coxiella sp. DG_40]|nr:MAG: hypothetical protein AMJ43_07415 [Coxiella sp. DG_40]
MLENHTIVCFGPSDWWGMNPSCTTHIMKRMALKNKVLYINPFSSDLLGAVRKGINKRIPRKLKSMAKFLRQPQRNLYVFSPIFLPFHGKPTTDMINNTLLRIQIKSVYRCIGLSKPILWVENLRAADLLDCVDPVIIVYYVSDLFTQCRYVANKEILYEQEEFILKASDLVICVSEELYAQKALQHNNTHYLPHGVDFELFQEAAHKSSHLEHFANIPKPTAGYFGTLTGSNDVDLFLWCAQNLPHISFVFAGQITGGDYSELAKLPNVYILGKVAYMRIPQLCASFDVCLLPWKMTEWIRCCNPLKMMEYMASGKPIVSVPIKEVVDNYSHVVSVAHNKEEFCNAIVYELRNDTPERSNRRVEIARQHSWNNHVKQISKWIMAVIQRKQCSFEKRGRVSHGNKE